MELVANGAGRFGFDGDDDEEEEQTRYGHEFSIGYGVTEFWMPSVGFEIEKARGESLEGGSVEFESKFAIPMDGLLATEAPFDLGFFPAYELVLDDDAPGLSEQEDRIGPVLSFGTELGEAEIGADIVVLFGLTEATPGYALEFNLEAEFEF